MPTFPARRRGSAPSLEPHAVNLEWTTHTPTEDKSAWLREAVAAEAPRQPLEGTYRADICIVGGGYTGLWTGLEIKDRDPALDVVVLEAEACGAGASGRNGGLALSLWPKFLTLQQLLGTEQAIAIARASSHAVREIGDFCARHRVDAAFRLEGSLKIATNEAQVDLWDATVAALGRQGVEPFRRVDRSEVAELCGATSLGGVYERDAATVQPALLARGLRKVAVERGIKIFERSPAKRVEGGDPAVVSTAQGRVTAPVVVIATDAWAARIPELRPALVVVSSDMILTEPLPRGRDDRWQGGLAVADSRMLVNYCRSTQDGRIAFGTGGGTLAFGGRVGPAFEGRAANAGDVLKRFHTLYPQFPDVKVVASWSGAVARSATGLPFFGRLSGQGKVLYGVGYSGTGIAPSLLGARILASLALDADDEWSHSGLVGMPAARLPPEPVRFFGGKLVRQAVKRKEQLEDSGRAPRGPTRWLARLAPGSPKTGGG